MHSKRPINFVLQSDPEQKFALQFGSPDSKSVSLNLLFMETVAWQTRSILKRWRSAYHATHFLLPKAEKESENLTPSAIECTFSPL